VNTDQREGAEPASAPDSQKAREIPTLGDEYVEDETVELSWVSRRSNLWVWGRVRSRP
jgi:hypothetical protein